MKYLIKIIVSCILLFLISSCTAAKVKNTSVNTYNNTTTLQKNNKKNRNQNFYVSFDMNTKNVDKVLLENNIIQVKFLNEDMVIDHQKNDIDVDEIKKNLEEIYPNITDSGICYIDVEDPYSEKIKNLDGNDPEFIKNLNLFLNIIKTAKKIRPNVKFGFYAIPFTTFWNDTDDYFKKNEKLAEIYKVSDFLFPSIYLLYDSPEVPISRNIEYININTKKSIEIGLKYNKPVIPFVMHRYHPSNKRISWEALSDVAWRNYVSQILDTNYNGNFVQGILWWAADAYYYDKPEGGNIRKNFKGSKEAFKINEENFTLKRINQILPYFKSNR